MIDLERILRYERLSIKTLPRLDRQTSVCLMALSPLEVHGYHLPVGTDVLIAVEVQRRLITALAEKHPGLSFVILPPLYAGADPLPFSGSIPVPPSVLEGLILAHVKGLADQGFKYLVITDNHGGPRHQMAIEAAVRKAWKKHRFFVIAPFNSLYRKMVECDPELLKKTGLAPGSCGDDTDAHAGTNETSLMTVAAPEFIDHGDAPVDSFSPPPLKGGAKTISLAARFLRACGVKQLSSDLEHLARTLAWISSPEKEPLMGNPGLASKEAGEAMFNAHVDEGLRLVEKALRGEPAFTDPLLWKLRILRKLPG